MTTWYEMVEHCREWLKTHEPPPPNPPDTRVTCPACSGDRYVDDVGASSPATQPCGYCDAAGLVAHEVAEAF